MTDVAAAWYSDPADPLRLRWWDGTVWTANVMQKPPAVANPTGTEPASAPAAAEMAAKIAYQAALDAEQARREAEYVPFVTTRQTAGYTSQFGANPYQAAAEFVPDYNPKRAQTLPGWFLATSPIWGGGAYYLARLLTWSAPPEVGAAIGGIGALFLMFGLAWLDSKRLRERGYARTTSPGWVLLPIVFFILRTVRVGARGVGMLVTYVLSGFALVVGAIVIFYFVGLAALHAQQATTATAQAGGSAARAPLTAAQRAYELTTTGATNTVFDELTRAGQNPSSVQCNAFPSAEAGSRTTCTALIGGRTVEYTIAVTPSDPYVAFEPVSAGSSSTGGSSSGS